MQDGQKGTGVQRLKMEKPKTDQANFTVGTSGLFRPRRIVDAILFGTISPVIFPKMRRKKP